MPQFFVTAAFSFALIALLYLVIAALLVEARHKPDHPLITSLFFIGIPGLLVLEAFIA